MYCDMCSAIYRDLCICKKGRLHNPSIHLPRAIVCLKQNSAVKELTTITRVANSRQKQK